MNLFFNWAAEQQEQNKKMTNDINPAQPMFSVRQDAHLKLDRTPGHEFMRDNLHFSNSRDQINEQDRYDRLVNATPEQRERLRELDRRQQARESNPTTGKYSTMLRTGGLDAAISALEDDGRQARVGQMRTDMASGAMKPRAATQTADSAIDSASPTQPDPMSDQTPSFDFTKPMVKNPAGGLMPDPNLAQSTIDDAPQPTGPSDFEKGREEGIRQANRNYTGGVTITKDGRSTIGSIRGRTGMQASLARGPRDLTKPVRSTASQARSSAAQAGRPPSAASMMNRSSDTANAMARAMKSNLPRKMGY